MDEAVARLRDLIDYVDAAERDRLSIAIDVAAHRALRWEGAEIVGLPGVATDLTRDGEPVWVSVQRLPRGTPPLPDDRELALWIEPSDDAETPPALRAEAEPAALRSAGLPIAEPRGRGARVRLVDYPRKLEVEAAHAGYVREVWKAWAREERPRRRTIALYNGLFALREGLDGVGGMPVELVCGIGMASWDRPRGQLRYPLITVPLEVAIDPASHAVEVRPRSEARVTVESDALDVMEAPSLDEWRRFAVTHIEAQGGLVSPFTRDEFEPILRRAVALLDANGHYLPDLAGTPASDGNLTVDDRWTLFARERRGTQVMEDLRRFRDAAETLPGVDALPDAVRALVTEPSDAVQDELRRSWRGISTLPGVTTADGSGEDLFFPKPFNREQVEVVQRLSHRSGVVVQGPPGTGKTHTIANVISHYLALGKRVLVTSQKAPALKVVRAQLPPSLRPLAVSLLDSDRDGLKQFEQSVETIAERLQRSRPDALRIEIADAERRIDALHRQLASIDRQVEEVGRSALSPIELAGERIAPVDAARRLVDNREASEWLDDELDAIRSHDPDFGDADVAAIRDARLRVGARLAYLRLVLPDPAALPTAESVSELHRDLTEHDRLSAALAPEERIAGAATAADIKAAEAQLERLSALRRSLERSGAGWAEPMLAQLREEPDDPAVAALAGLRARVDAAAAEARHFLTRPVLLPGNAGGDRALREMVDALAAGEQPGLFSSFFARATLQRVGEIRHCGRAPASAEEWNDVVRFFVAEDTLATLVAAWNHAAAHAGLAPVDGSSPDAAASMRRQLDALDAITVILREEAAAETSIAQLFVGRSALLRDRTAIDAARDLLGRHVQRLRLGEADRGRIALRAAVRDIPCEIGEALRRTAAKIGQEGEDGGAIARAWSASRAEIEAVAALEADFATIRRVAEAIEESGAPRWAARLRNEPAPGARDPLAPGDWRERWQLRRLRTCLDRIDAHDRLGALARERLEAERQLARSYEEAIELRTWCGLAEQATDGVRSALAAYGQAVRRLGRGTGIRAGRYRADARAAADRAKSVLPCWIMPHYRVSESLPAEFGLFDLVIVDEASQSTIAALPALMRAKQVLIVGDDRQVSPDAGFRDEARMSQLAQRHLSAQVGHYREALREEKSLYDLGSVVFAGGAIMLREHFRCVAPIIEFSKSQFYDHKLEPLRLPKTSERIDPPLVDILVEDGVRRGKVNRAEIECIVDEIRRIAEDPTLAGRSVGVTTLLGQEQAAALYKAIETELGTELIQRHDIRVGEPSAFQGDERDIMFVSLVADRESSGLSGRAFEQRFNVAASRARDRMVLVRSVEASELRQSDALRRALIDHFHAPFAGESAQATERRTRCESPFEEAMFDRLVERGYRVDTQVRVGTKRIDLVVEGDQDRRLAIECDGDRYHGPDRWPDDMARQRLLERAGWTVWRCFASRFVREPDRVIEELVATLAVRGIEPSRGAEEATTRYTEHRRWRSSDDNGAGKAPVPYAWLVPAEPFDGIAVAAE